MQIITRNISKAIVTGVMVATAALNHCAASDAPEAATSEREIEWKEREFRLAERDYWLKLIGGLGAGAAFIVGLMQYRKGEHWKRTEFLATQMKEFFADPVIQNVLTMVDWGPRRIDLFLTGNPAKFILVSRTTQVLALLPHTLLPRYQNDGTGGEAATDAAPARFTPEDAKDWKIDWGRMTNYGPTGARIRDSYDRFLDGLERFGAYVKTDLIAKQDLEHFLEYWINDIVADSQDEDEAAWTCSLLAYIHVYGYRKVQGLFETFGHDISPGGPIYQRHFAMMEKGNKAFADRLRDICR